MKNAVPKSMTENPLFLLFFHSKLSLFRPGESFFSPKRVTDHCRDPLFINFEASGPPRIDFGDSGGHLGSLFDDVGVFMVDFWSLFALLGPFGVTFSISWTHDWSKNSKNSPLITSRVLAHLSGI